METDKDGDPWPRSSPVTTDANRNNPNEVAGIREPDGTTRFRRGIYSKDQKAELLKDMTEIAKEEEKRRQTIRKATAS